MTKFKKVFSALLAGFISMSNLNLECQAYGCVLPQAKKPQHHVSIYHLAEIYNNCENAFWSVVVAREKVKFISEKMGRGRFYIPYLNEIVGYLKFTLITQKAFLYMTSNGDLDGILRLYNRLKKTFINQSVDLNRILYILGIKLGELKMKNPKKYLEADDEFQKNYFPSWKARWNGIEIYKL